jgi:hypothetical protein
LGVVGIDSSGILKDPPESVWMAAVRKVVKQKHNILFLSPAECMRYRKIVSDEWWRERIGAALIFKSLHPLIKPHDIVQIHSDFKGKKRRVIVDGYLHRLFGIYYCGQYPLSNIKIQFIAGDATSDIQLAHDKSWRARHGWKDNVFDCPDLCKLLSNIK